jgi:hypothetical protein
LVAGSFGPDGWIDAAIFLLRALQQLLADRQQFTRRASLGIGYDICRFCSVSRMISDTVNQMLGLSSVGTTYQGGS